MELFKYHQNEFNRSYSWANKEISSIGINEEVNHTDIEHKIQDAEKSLNELGTSLDGLTPAHKTQYDRMVKRFTTNFENLKNSYKLKKQEQKPKNYSKPIDADKQAMNVIQDTGSRLDNIESIGYRSEQKIIDTTGELYGQRHQLIKVKRHADEVSENTRKGNRLIWKIQTKSRIRKCIMYVIVVVLVIAILLVLITKLT